MCCHRRFPGLGLIVVGLFIATLGAVHYFRGGCHRAHFEQHVAEVCVKAAQQVQK